METKSISDPNLFESFPKETPIPAGGGTGSHGFLYDFGEHTYRVLDLNLQGLSRLKLNLKVSKGDLFHIDTLDLYMERARERFAQSAGERFGVEQEKIMKELYTLIEKLDAKRSEMLKVKPEAQPEMSQVEHEEALAFLRSAALIEQIQKDFLAAGFIGEETARLFGYLAATSRFMEKPLGLLILSRSGAGKSSLQEAICKFIPEEDLENYARMSGKVLYYKLSLKHKVLAIAEDKGAEDAIYPIRILQSEQRLSVSVATTDPKTGEKRAEEYEVEGPVAIFFTSTSTESMDFETRNRFAMLTIDESREQTERILEMQRRRYTLEGRLSQKETEPIFRKHHNAQRLLKERTGRGVVVVNPYADDLTYPSDKLLMRREHEKYLTLIMTIAFLRQFQKEIKTARTKTGKVLEYVEADLEDIALANTLAAEILGRSLDELSPHTRRLLTLIKTMVDEHSGKEKENYVFNRKEVCDYTGWSYWQLREPMEMLVKLEYLALIKSQKHNQFVYELLWDGQGENGGRFFMGLIDVESLRKQRRKRA